jgi:hypothetical protein
MDDSKSHEGKATPCVMDFFDAIGRKIVDMEFAQKLIRFFMAILSVHPRERNCPMAMDESRDGRMASE